MSQVKSESDVCSQEMYGYGSLLVLITPFIEYVLKVTIKIIFHHSKTVCKIYKLSILRGGGGHTNPMFCCSSVRKNRNFVRKKKSGNLIDSHVWEPWRIITVYVPEHLHLMCQTVFSLNKHSCIKWGFWVSLAHVTRLVNCTAFWDSNKREGKLDGRFWGPLLEGTSGTVVMKVIWQTNEALSSLVHLASDSCNK